MQDEAVLAELSRAGFEAHDKSRWVLDAGQSRTVWVNISEGGATTDYSIYVEEWRGGEGYEDEELRTTSPTELVAAIPTWAAWARDPFVKPTTWWGRLRTYFGLEDR